MTYFRRSSRQVPAEVPQHGQKHLNVLNLMPILQEGASYLNFVIAVSQSSPSFSL